MFCKSKKNNTNRQKFDIENNNYSLKDIKTTFGEGIIFNEDLLY